MQNISDALSSQALEKDYTRQSRHYDQKRYLNQRATFTSTYESALLRKAIETYAPQRRTLVDVACGTGHFTLQVANLFHHVVGIDLTRAMLEQAQAKQKTKTNLGVSFVQGSVTDLPFPDDYADVVISTRFLHLFPRERHPEIVTHLMRVIRPGGILILEHDWYYGLYRRIRTGYWSTYHAGEVPEEIGRRLVRIGVLAPGLPTLAQFLPWLATWLAQGFVSAPLNRLSTRVILVYQKRARDEKR
jgi:ubiquinone/menaquinone biosynthesis C-methylase UbiE